jgi:AcrR family transcriptional regulator
MTLMQQRQMESISISDLAEAAQINRTTFYLHYTNLKEVLDDIEKDIAIAITSCFGKFDCKNIYGSTYYLFLNLTHTLDRSPILKNFILRSTINNYLVQRLKDIFLEKWLTCFMKVTPAECSGKCYYDLMFMTGGIIDTYVKWSTDDKKEQTLEELCRNIGKLAELITTRLDD